MPKRIYRGYVLKIIQFPRSTYHISYAIEARKKIKENNGKSKVYANSKSIGKD